MRSIWIDNEQNREEWVISQLTNTAGTHVSGRFQHKNHLYFFQSLPKLHQSITLTVNHLIRNATMEEEVACQARLSGSGRHCMILFYPLMRSDRW